MTLKFWSTIVLITGLLSGCASISPRHTEDAALSPISARSRQELLAVLVNAPEAIRQAVTQDVAARLPDEGQQLSQDLRAALLDLLSHTRQQALLPDATFERLYDVVIGTNQPLRQVFPTALAGYLTSADFGCQQPIFARYFDQRYASAGKEQQCLAEVPFSVLTQYDGIKTVWLDPKRVKSIHLLFAGKSKSIASQFGHIALRFIVCPEGDTTDMACNANLREHLVLGFQAHIDEFSLNTIKALNGSYRAYLFANRFMDVYEGYAIGEFRDIYSLPLRLSDTQRALMVRELADVHWRYSGEYNFFTSNCTTMLQNALRTTWPEFALNDSLKDNYLRPDSLFEAIKPSVLFAGDKLASLDAAEREGHYFSSSRQIYDRALHVVRAAMTQPAFTDLEGYLGIDPIIHRQNRAADTRFSARIATDQYLREAQILLDEYAVLRSERMLMVEMAKYLEEQDILTNADSIRAQLDAEHAKVFEECILTPIRQHTSPVQRLSGIPNKADTIAASGRISMCNTSQSRKLIHEAIATFKPAQSDQWQRLNEISQYCAESIVNVQMLHPM